MVNHSCCIVDCPSDSRKLHNLTQYPWMAGVKFRCFPTHPSTRRRWVRLTRRDPWTPTNNSRICARHFDGLNKDPSLFPYNNYKKQSLSKTRKPPKDRSSLAVLLRKKRGRKLVHDDTVLQQEHVTEDAPPEHFQHGAPSADDSNPVQASVPDAQRQPMANNNTALSKKPKQKPKSKSANKSTKRKRHKTLKEKAEIAEILTHPEKVLAQKSVPVQNVDPIIPEDKSGEDPEQDLVELAGMFDDPIEQSAEENISIPNVTIHKHPLVQMTRHIPDSSLPRKVLKDIPEAANGVVLELSKKHIDEDVSFQYESCRFDEYPRWIPVSHANGQPTENNSSNAQNPAKGQERNEDPVLEILRSINENHEIGKIHKRLPRKSPEVSRRKPGENVPASNMTSTLYKYPKCTDVHANVLAAEHKTGNTQKQDKKQKPAKRQFTDILKYIENSQGRKVDEIQDKFQEKPVDLSRVAETLEKVQPKPPELITTDSPLDSENENQNINNSPAKRRRMIPYPYWMSDDGSVDYARTIAAWTHLRQRCGLKPLPPALGPLVLPPDTNPCSGVQLNTPPAYDPLSSLTEMASSVSSSRSSPGTNSPPSIPIVNLQSIAELPVTTSLFPISDIYSQKPASMCDSDTGSPSVSSLTETASSVGSPWSSPGTNSPPPISNDNLQSIAELPMTTSSFHVSGVTSQKPASTCVSDASFASMCASVFVPNAAADRGTSRDLQGTTILSIHEPIKLQCPSMSMFALETAPNPGTLSSLQDSTASSMSVQETHQASRGMQNTTVLYMSEPKSTQLQGSSMHLPVRTFSPPPSMAVEETPTHAAFPIGSSFPTSITKSECADMPSPSMHLPVRPSSPPSSMAVEEAPSRPALPIGSSFSTSMTKTETMDMPPPSMDVPIRTSAVPPPMTENTGVAYPISSTGLLVSTEGPQPMSVPDTMKLPSPSVHLPVVTPCMDASMLVQETTPVQSSSGSRYRPISTSSLPVSNAIQESSQLQTSHVHLPGTVSSLHPLLAAAVSDPSSTVSHFILIPNVSTPSHPSVTLTYARSPLFPPACVLRTPSPLTTSRPRSLNAAPHPLLQPKALKPKSIKMCLQEKVTRSGKVSIESTMKRVNQAAQSVGQVIGEIITKEVKSNRKSDKMTVNVSKNVSNAVTKQLTELGAANMASNEVMDDANKVLEAKNIASKAIDGALTHKHHECGRMSYEVSNTPSIQGCECCKRNVIENTAVHVIAPLTDTESTRESCRLPNAEPVSAAFEESCEFQNNQQMTEEKLDETIKDEQSNFNADYVNENMVVPVSVHVIEPFTQPVSELPEENYCRLQNVVELTEPVDKNILDAVSETLMNDENLSRGEQDRLHRGSTQEGLTTPPIKQEGLGQIYCDYVKNQNMNVNMECVSESVMVHVVVPVSSTEQGEGPCECKQEEETSELLTTCIKIEN